MDFSHSVILHYLISYIHPLVVDRQQQDVFWEENHQSFLKSLQKQSQQLLLYYLSNTDNDILYHILDMYYFTNSPQVNILNNNCSLLVIFIPIGNDNIVLS